MNTFEDFKNQVAVKNGYQDWKEWKRYCEGETEMEEMVTEATTLFVESERKRMQTEVDKYKALVEAQDKLIKSRDMEPMRSQPGTWQDWKRRSYDPAKKEVDNLKTIK